MKESHELNCPCHVCKVCKLEAQVAELTEANKRMSSLLFEIGKEMSARMLNQHYGFSDQFIGYKIFQIVNTAPPQEEKKP